MSAGEQLPPGEIPEELLSELPPELLQQLMGAGAPQGAVEPPPAPPQPDPAATILQTIDVLATAARTSAGSNPEGAYRLMQGVLAGAQAITTLAPPVPPETDDGFGPA